eukprot:TRINITY_DN5182_c0_g2_i1.p1 TRINITY_DN5182_c0_g2~~TRINITY_DN5182_c0_g2_i1.p1  ORF type:complete len:387 (+),score=79.69 TRINITY_DN5182_c0_g2_i1:171-1331(+)
MPEPIIREARNSRDDEDISTGQQTRVNSRAARNWRLAKHVLWATLFFKSTNKLKSRPDLTIETENGEDSVIPNIQTRSRSGTRPESTRDGKQLWELLRNTMKGVVRFSQIQTKAITDVDDIIGEIEACNIVEDPTGWQSETIDFEKVERDREIARANHVFNDALKQFRRESKWMELANIGSPESIKEMEKLLEDDPSRHYDHHDPRRLVNVVDKDNRSALYLAAMSGNAPLVHFLVTEGANPHIGADIGGKKPESPLECASRWGYYAVVRVLLEKSSFKRKIMKRAVKRSDSMPVKRLLRCHSKQNQTNKNAQVINPAICGCSPRIWRKKALREDIMLDKQFRKMFPSSEPSCLTPQPLEFVPDLADDFQDLPASPTSQEGQSDRL